MKIIKPSVKLIWITPEPLKKIELAGRTCYKSEDKITDGSAEKFVEMLIKRGHEAMIEHASVSYRLICDRGVTHELVRHRLFSYAQESTRYVNYQEKGMEVIVPPWVNIPEGEYNELLKPEADTPDRLWRNQMYWGEKSYNRLLDLGWTPQQARSVLPNSLKTEIVITGNLRQWRHFFKMRTTKFAHPQMKEVADMLLEDIKKHIPIIFDDVRGE